MRDKYGLRIQRPAITIGGNQIEPISDDNLIFTETPKKGWQRYNPCKKTAWLAYYENEQGFKCIRLPARDIPLILPPGHSLQYESKRCDGRRTEHSFYTMYMDEKILIHQYDL